MPSNELPSQWSLVIDNPLDNPSGLSCEYILQQLNGLWNFVAVIYHDDDYNDEGEKKTPHYHLILEGKRIRKETLIKKLTKLLNIPSNCISCKEIMNFKKAVRYITHIDYEEKTLYLLSDVYTNDRKYLNGFFVDRLENINEEILIDVVRVERTTSKILKRIGEQNYKKYAQIIRDLQKELA